jgi:hypothetical protein
LRTLSLVLLAAGACIAAASAAATDTAARIWIAICGVELLIAGFTGLVLTTAYREAKASSPGKWRYVAKQLAILVIPALVSGVFDHFRRASPYINSYLEDVAICLSGLSGLLIAFPARAIGGSDESGVIVFLVLYVVIAAVFFAFIYKPEGRRNVTMIGINAWCSIWSILLGHLFMFLAMQ